MREEIARLTSLQMLDQQLRTREQELSKVSARVDELRARVEQRSAQLEQLQQEVQEAERNRRELERNLAEGEAQIRNKRMRLNLIKSDRELQALGHEVDALKEANQRLEADLLARMEGGEQRTSSLKELGEQLEQERKELKAAEQEIAGQTEELRAQIALRRKEREQLAVQIDNTLFARYEVIFDRRGGMAVVAVKAGTCQGCRMRIPPQLFNLIQRSDTIYYCPNCQRILYFESDKESSA